MKMMLNYSDLYWDYGSRTVPCFTRFIVFLDFRICCSVMVPLLYIIQNSGPQVLLITA